MTIIGWECGQFDPLRYRDYHETGASKPGDRCFVQVLRFSGLAGARERKVRTPQDSVLANGEGPGGIPDSSGCTPWVRKVPQKIYRRAGAFGRSGAVRGKRGGPGSPGIKVRAHRLSGDIEGMVNPTRSKTK